MDKRKEKEQCVALSCVVNNGLKVAFTACFFTFSSPVMAMQVLDDSDLAAVSGQDGLTINIDATDGWSADSVTYRADSGTALESELNISTVALDGVNTDGSQAGAAPANADFTMDFGADSGGLPLLALGLHTNSRIRVRSDSVTIPTAGNARSLGTFAFDFSGGIDLVNNGIFNADYDKAYLYGEINDGDLFYRQGGVTAPWMAMHEFKLKWHIPEGTLGIDSEGIIHQSGSPWSVGDAQRPFDPNDPGYIAPSESDLIKLALDFEYIVGAGNATEEFLVDSTARGLMHFGWLGSIKDAQVKWMPGGVWQGATAGVFDPYGVDAVDTEGLRFSSQWDYVNLDDISNSSLTADDEFRWRLGETADVASADQSSINFELGDWVMWGERSARKPAAHYFPLIALDVINGAGQGPGGLCWGHGPNYVNSGGSCGSSGQFMNVQPGRIGDYYGFSHTGDSGALAVIVRDGQLQAYSRKVRLLETDSAGNESTREFDWGLIYSLANVDANFYLYPGGTVYDSGAGSYVAGNGIIADILLKSQTLDTSNELQADNWDHGTHLMIADTEANMGIGFMSSSFVVAGNDTRIWVKPQDGGDYYSGGIDIFSPEARFNYRAIFGGGLLPGHPDYDPDSTTQAQTVRGANLDLNLEGLVNLRFSPSDPNESNNIDGSRNYLGFSGALSLGSNLGDGMIGATTNLSTCGSDGQSTCGSYLSIAEPSQPNAALKLANITGDLAFTDGRVDVVGTNEIAPGSEPKMVIAKKIKAGYAAAADLGAVLDTVPGISSANAGQPVMIDNIMLGEANLGRMVIPSAQIYSSITLEPQSAAVPFTP